MTVLNLTALNQISRYGLLNGDWSPTGAWTFGNTGLKLLDTGGDHSLNLVVNENLTANRVLNLVTGDATRTITLSGNPTLGDWFDQSVKQAASPTLANLLLSGGKIYPTADSTTAIQITKADGATVVLNVDTTYRRVGVNTAPVSTLEVLSPNQAFKTAIFRAALNNYVNIFEIQAFNGVPFLTVDSSGGLSIVTGASSRTGVFAQSAPPINSASHAYGVRQLCTLSGTAGTSSGVIFGGSYGVSAQVGVTGTINSIIVGDFAAFTIANASVLDLKGIRVLLDASVVTVQDAKGIYVGNINRGSSSNYGIYLEGGLTETIHAETGSATAIGIAVKLAAGQTANAFEVQSSGAPPNILAKITATGGALFSDHIEITDAKNLVLGTTTGTKLGTATAQKLGFWNVAPVVQQVLATGAGATVDNVITMLQTVGLCRQA